jgi:hypothetical protein
LQVFPRPWREWVSDAAQWVGSSEDYVAQALLASVAGLCGQGVSARITGAWSEPVIPWRALVGGASPKPNQWFCCRSPSNPPIVSPT